VVKPPLAGHLAGA